MSISSSQVVSGQVPRKVLTTITGNGNTLSFTIAHNLNTEDILISAREVSDSMRQAFLENYPDPSDPKNKLIISFDFAPRAIQSYKIMIVG